mmetsp:Transcript_9960/g.13675  ORF Transcript_9960/g.13675 Transcript_9960/m.13675 type:complete len:339 (+) Transcript_9960:158-1174(+)
MEDKPQTFHLVVFVHGNHGLPSDWDNLASLVEKKFQKQRIDYFFVKSASNSKDTHVGIEIGGKNLADEITTAIMNKINPSKKVSVYISFVCHSLGGLFARSALQILFLHPLSQILHPTSFISICSPHLGARKASKLFPVARWTAHTICEYLYEQTGQDLMLNSDALQNLAETDPLDHFKEVTLVGLTHNDLPVTMCSATIATNNPFSPPHVSAGLELAGSYGFDSSVYGHLLMKNLSIDSKKVPYTHFHKNEILKSENKYESDNMAHAEFSTQMMKTLEEKSRNWRRIFLSVGVALALVAHDLPIKKPEKLTQIHCDPEGSDAFLNLISDVLLLDHVK